MVDQIKSTIASSSKATQTKPSSSTSSKALKSSVDNSIKTVNTSKSKNDTTNISNNISKFVNKSAIKEMASEPPIDKVNVSRIKDAIASNNYPIDIEKIADALMDAYKEMK